MDLEWTRTRRSYAEKVLVCMVALFVCVCGSLFAADATITELEDKAGKLLDLFSGRVIAIVMCVALMVIFGIIAWGNSQGEGGMFKKMLPWIVGVIGIGSAAGITSYFLGVSVN